MSYYRRLLTRHFTSTPSTHPTVLETVFVTENSHIVPSIYRPYIAFGLPIKKQLDREEYIKMADFFLEIGIDHYIAKIDHNIGPAAINLLQYFADRPDLECMCM